MAQSNIYKLPSGNYRVRKQVNGKRVSRTFTKQREAKEWLTNFK